MRHRCCMCHHSNSPFLFISQSMLGAMQPAPPCLLRPPVSAPGCANESEILTEAMELSCRVYHSLSISFFELELARHPYLSAAKHWIELNPCHIGFGDKRGVAARTFGRRSFFS